MNKEHYFDWAATSPADEDILQESLAISIKSWGNPSSVHQIGKNAALVLQEARSTAAKVLGVKAENIYFTSGGTESDQIALLSILNKPQKGTVLISSIEHPAIREQALALKKCGCNVVQIPCDSKGIICVESLEKLITNDTMLVCVMAVNNETGAIQPIYQIADLLKKVSQGKRKPKFHVDCVQAAGKIPLDLNYDGIDSAALSAHKICGPRGIGIFYSKNPIEPFLCGGGQEKGIRSGTENLFGAVAFSKCLERYFIKNNDNLAIQKYNEQVEITNSFIKKLSELKGCTIIPENRANLEDSSLYSPWVIQASFKNIPGNVMLRALDSKGFFISTGSACSTKKQSRPILEAMNVNKDLRESSVRFSFGPHTTQKAIDELFDAVKEVNATFNK
ncbi:MAG: cysteine desulfurase [Treponema bryantii]|nr:cysteine desulfurase [Treponema bryantii]